MGSFDKQYAPWRNAAVAREIGVGMVASLLFFSAVVLMPVVGIFMGIFTPLPTLLSFYRWGSPLGFAVPAGSALAATLLLLAFDLTRSLPFFLEMLLLGLVLATGMRRQWSIERTIGGGCLLVLIWGLVLFWIPESLQQGNLVAGLEDELRRAVSATLKQLGGDSSELAGLEQSVQELVPLIVKLIPGAALASSLIMAWLNILVTHRYCTMHRLPWPQWPPFSRWKSWEPLVWAVIGCGFGWLIPVEAIQVLCLNALIVLGTIYFLQGLAVIACFLDKWRWPPVFRTLAYGLVFIQQPLSLGVALLGLFDLWFDFRRYAGKGDLNNAVP